LTGKRIKPAIKIRKNASTRARGSPARANHVRGMKELGYEGWRDKYRYGQRWIAEGFFSGTKRTFWRNCKSKNHRRNVSRSRDEIFVLWYIDRFVRSNFFSQI